MTRHSLELARWPSAGSHHKDGRYSPSTKQSDISRLLDPAYQPVASSSYSSNGSSLGSHSPSRTEVYVDHRGDLHDPDYRHFPAFPSSSPTKRRASQRVPAWERASPISRALDLDEDESEAEEPNVYSYSRPHTPVPRITRSSSSPPRMRPQPYASASATTGYYAYYPEVRVPAHTHHVHSAPANATASFFDSPTPVDSYIAEPQEDALAVEEHARAEDVAEERPSRVLRRKSKTKKEISSPLSEKPLEGADEDSDDHTLSCVDAVRVQFQAFKLRLRFGIFRARRRVRRKIAGG